MKGFLARMNKKILVIAVATVVLIVGGSALAFGLSTANRSGWNISEQEAKNAAFAHAGITEDEVVALQVRKEMEDGASVYEIEFRTADRSYDYDVAGSSGEILKSSYDAVSAEMIGEDAGSQGAAAGETAAEPQATETEAVPAGETAAAQTQQASGSSVAAITEEEAKNIALADAGVAESDTQYMRVREDRDDGRTVYDVEFYANGTEYDYAIDKESGQILGADFDIENYVPTSSSVAISLEEATSIALARVSGATESDIRIHLDSDDGYQVYEGEIRYGQMEYEFAIDASNGTIIEWSADHWD